MNRTRPLWWATWPGAIGFGLVSLLMVAPAIFGSLLFISLAADDSAGLDYEVRGPGLFARLLAVLLLVGSAALPFLTVFWARKRWAGYLLLGVCLSLTALLVGLFMLGIL